MIVAEPEVVLPMDVIRYLRTRSAESEFDATHEAVREFFPELVSLRVFLQVDPDEAGRAKVVFEIQLPRSTSIEELGDRRQTFYTELHQRLPSPIEPVCGLLIDLE